MTNIIHKEWTLNAPDGMSSFGQLWQVPDSLPAKAILLLVHGLGEHSSRYEHVGRYMALNRIHVVAIDLRGHGKSAGRRGDVASYTVFHDQIDQTADEARRQLGNLPLFIYGHSLGGNIVINYTLVRQPKVRGVVISAPWLRAKMTIPSGKLLMAKIMHNIWGGYAEDNGLNANHISRIPEVVNAYQNDPLVHRKISVRLFWEGLNSAKYAFEHATDLNVPMLLMHGTADNITDANASAEFAQLNPSRITFKLWEGLYHELHNEPEQEKIMGTVYEWINGLLES